MMPTCLEVTVARSKATTQAKPLVFTCFPGRSLYIGRSSACDVILNTAGVSHRHAEIFLKPADAFESGIDEDVARLGTHVLCVRDTSANGTGVRSAGVASTKPSKLTWDAVRSWEKIACGDVRAVGCGWQLKVPLKGRRGSMQVAEEDRTLILEARVIVGQETASTSVQLPSGGETHPIAPVQHVADVGDSDKKNKKKKKKEKQARKQNAQPTDAISPLVSTSITADDASARASLLDANQVPKISIRKEKSTRKQRDRTEREPHEQNVQGAQTQEVANDLHAQVARTSNQPSQQSAQVSSHQLRVPLGSSPPRMRSHVPIAVKHGVASDLAAGIAVPDDVSDTEGVVTQLRGEESSSAVVGSGQSPIAARSKCAVRAPRQGKGDHEHVPDSSPERAQKVRRRIQNESHVQGPTAQHSHPQLRLTENTIKVVAAAAAHANSKRQERQKERQVQAEAASPPPITFQEPWRTSAGLPLSSQLAGPSMLRDMSISPISTPGVGVRRKGKTKHRQPHSSSDDDAAATAVASMPKQKKKRKRETKLVAAGGDKKSSRDRLAPPWNHEYDNPPISGRVPKGKASKRSRSPQRRRG